MELALLFPTTVSGWVIQILTSLLGSYVVISTLEYVFHRFLMHQGLPEWAYRYAPFLKPIRDHHRRHHTQYYKQFDFEPDPVGRDLNLTFGPEHFFLIMVAYAPLLVLTTYTVSVVPAIVFLCVTYVHYRTWNLIHVAMHHGDHAAWTGSPVYRFLARNHYLHHQDTRTRFNIVCPLADYVVGSRNGPTDTEIAEMERLGFLK